MPARTNGIKRTLTRSGSMDLFIALILITLSHGQAKACRQQALCAKPSHGRNMTPHGNR